MEASGILALIPARGGSRGIPRKNITPLCHRPLISWTIESALLSGAFDEVWVSTDDEDVAMVAEDWGARVHFRHPETATDHASSESAMVDFLKYHPCHVICLIQATSPLTLPRHFAEALLKFQTATADSLVTVTREHIFLWSSEGKALNYDPANRPRRQDWEGALVENGAFYITRVSTFLRTQNRLGGTTITFEIPSEHSADIDTIHDLKACEFLLYESLSKDKGCQINTETTAPMRRTRATAPVRIDLAGGWTDVPLYADKYGGEVVSMAINLRSYAEVSTKEGDRLEVKYGSSSAVGSGLGTTGSVNVALVAAIDKNSSNRKQLAERAFQLETVLGNIGGRQDQFVAAYGGFQHMCFREARVNMQDFSPPSRMKEYLSQHLLLFDSGIRHLSGDLHRSIWSKLCSGEERCLSGFHQLKIAARVMAKSLLTDNQAGVGKALNLVCEGVDMIDKRIHGPFRHVLQPLVDDRRVLGWKATGAGAGGCLIVLLQNTRFTQEICDVFISYGWNRILWECDERGVQVEELSI